MTVRLRTAVLLAMLLALLTIVARMETADMADHARWMGELREAGTAVLW